MQVAVLVGFRDAARRDDDTLARKFDDGWAVYACAGRRERGAIDRGRDRPRRIVEYHTAGAGLVQLLALGLAGRRRQGALADRARAEDLEPRARIGRAATEQRLVFALETRDSCLQCRLIEWPAPDRNIERIGLAAVADREHTLDRDRPARAGGFEPLPDAGFERGEGVVHRLERRRGRLGV